MCGGPAGECSDAEREWFPQRTICYQSMANEVANRAYQEQHRDKPFHDGEFQFWAAEYSPMTPFHFDDGVRVWVSDEDLTPDDDFLP